MGSLGRATAAGGLWLLAMAFGAAGLGTGSAVAGDDAYYPAGADKAGPRWERPKSTHFSVTRCSSRTAVIDQLVINRDDISEKAGLASYTDATRGKGYEQGAGGWTLAGNDLKVSGDGFELQGRWVGALMTATITRPGGGEPVRCRYEVAALRSFTEYQ
jgi:hypothetical protein